MIIVTIITTIKIKIISSSSLYSSYSFICSTKHGHIVLFVWGGDLKGNIQKFFFDVASVTSWEI
jgi:Tfp pilus tip-associated adhesin PilY1